MIRSEALRPVKPLITPSLRLRILDDDQDVVPVRRDHDLVLCTSESQERQAIRLIQRSHDPIRLEAQLADKSRIVVCVFLAKI